MTIARPAKKQIAVPLSAVGKKARCSGCLAVFVLEARAPAGAAETVDMLEEVADEPLAEQTETAVDMLEEITEELPARGAKKKRACEGKRGRRPSRRL